MLLERTRSSRSEGLRALASVRGSAYCCSCSSCYCCFSNWVFVVECVFLQLVLKNKDFGCVL